MKWNLDTKVKVFQKVFHVSWNAPETGISWNALKESFTVYPCL